jgi:hypothetical protein
LPVQNKDSEDYVRKFHQKRGRIRDPVKFITNPGGKKHRIPNPDPQHWNRLGMYRILFLPDIRPTGYPANPKAGYRISGRILGLKTKFLVKNIK